MQASQFRSRRIPQSLLCTLLIASALLMPSLLRAQAYFGTVSGELTDATGAVIPGASVTLLDEEKGFNFNTTSDTSGRYLFRIRSSRTVLGFGRRQGLRQSHQCPLQERSMSTRTRRRT